MASPGDSDGDESDSNRRSSSLAAAALKVQLNRKRTKTGCLTCRKRRIKCGEERPVCKNCIKSKRLCEGYNQRVIFKPPTFDFRPVAHGGAHITFQAGPVPGPATPYQAALTYRNVDAAAYSQLRPRPIQGLDPLIPQQVQHHEPQQYYDGAQLQFAAPHMFPGPYPHQQQQPQPLYYDPSAWFQAMPPGVGVAQPMHGAGFANPGNDMLRQAAQPIAISQPPQINGAYPQATVSGPPFIETQLSNPASSSRRTSSQISPHSFQHRHVEVTSQALAHDTPATVTWPQPSSITYPEPIWPDNHFSTNPAQAQTQTPPPPTVPPVPHTPDYVTPECYDQQPHIPPDHSPNSWLNQAAVEVQDDDYYDIRSDEDMDIDPAALAAADCDRESTFSAILHANHISVQELHTRRYDTFLHDRMLDHYRPEKVANPLRNPATARVFAHFVSVTGPSLSIFERHPRNTSVLFTEGQVPLSQRGLWTYTMPMAALHHQGLLHAMLALASLHISRLTGASPTPSMMHYAWALKRVHHCVGHPRKRLELTTIAASMLLGFYEIMTADHVKWNTHLMGSKQLFVETDFVGMTQQFRRMKMQRAAQYQNHQRRLSTASFDQFQDDHLDQILDVNERLLSDLVGREVRYGDHGQVVTPQTSIPPELDLNKFEILKDLYWWFCKQDAYQSIISGNPLLMDYSRWANCPPRAPLGKPDAVHGSFDHLVLLLGRVADFAARDRKRKLRQVDANGGQWRPAPGMNIPRPPPQNAPPTPMSATMPSAGPNGVPPPHAQGPPPPSMPTFYGMAPPPRQNIQMPSSYRTSDNLPSPQSAAPHDTVDLQLATQAALDEYGRIRGALRTFAASLGKAYEPLAPELQPIKETAFGPAIFYRSFDIGCLWAVYNMTVVIAIRSHPFMPPAAHMAAGIAAQETAPLANEIGRMVAGIVMDSPEKPLNPSLGAVLSESCMPSFFAAVQYRDPRQRHETVMRIFDIARRTGWGSAELIAHGCETSWIKAAEMGRGPPYERVVRNMRPQYGDDDDPRVSGSWERLDPHAMPNELDDRDRRLVKVKPNARVTWAIGIIGTEEDLKSIG